MFQIQKRSKVKPFLKLVNYSHVMPTRYRSHPHLLGASFPCCIGRLVFLAQLLLFCPSCPVMSSARRDVGGRYSVDAPMQFKET